MPYPNEHACRIREPSEFQNDSFRRIKSGSVSIIIGRLKGETKTTTQAIRYPKDSWDAERARKDCADKGGKFTAASTEAQAMIHQDENEYYMNPLNNDLIP